MHANPIFIATVGVSDTDDFGDFDVGNFGGLGIFGGFFLLIVMFLVNWKFNNVKSINRRFDRYKKTKDETANSILKNDQQQEILKDVIEQKEKAIKKQEEKIEEIVEKASVEIKEAQKEKNPKITVYRIKDNWKG